MTTKEYTDKLNRAYLAGQNFAAFKNYFFAHLSLSKTLALLTQSTDVIKHVNYLIIPIDIQSIQDATIDEIRRIVYLYFDGLGAYGNYTIDLREAMFDAIINIIKK